VGYEGVLNGLVLVGGAYWLVAGALLTGETAQLSPRALRRLPQSFLGRMLFTWFNPGSATGYVFTVINLAVLLLVGYLVPATGWLQVGRLSSVVVVKALPDLGDWICLAGCVLGYVAAYLGLTRIFVVTARRITSVGMLAAFLCHVIVIVGGILMPLLLQAAISWGDYSSFTYSPLQLSNWFWTLLEIGKNGAGTNSIRALIVIAPAGSLIFLINFLMAAREVEHVRLAAPRRVIEDELLRHPERLTPKKRNPWDDGVDKDEGGRMKAEG
jgi:hypothetical protein